MNANYPLKRALAALLIAILSVSGVPCVPVAYAEVEDRVERSADGAVRAYTVRHVLQNVDGTYGTVADTETLTGAVGEWTAAGAKTYEGFTCLGVENQCIGETGDIVITVRYERNPHYVTWHDGISDDAATTRYLFGQTIAYPADPVIAGHEFLGWFTLDGQKVDVDAMPDEDLVLYAKYDPAIEASIMVEYYVQNVTDDVDAASAEKSYALAKRIDSTTAPVDATWDEIKDEYADYAENGMTFDYAAATTEAANADATVLPDGSTVFKIYFDRPVITIVMQYWKDGLKANATEVGRARGLYGASTDTVVWPTYTHEDGESEDWDGDPYWMLVDASGGIYFRGETLDAFSLSQSYIATNETGEHVITMAFYGSHAKYYNAATVAGKQTCYQYIHLEGLEANTWPEELVYSKALGDYTSAIGVTEDGTTGFTTAAGEWGDFSSDINRATIDFTYYWNYYAPYKITLNWRDPNGSAVNEGSASTVINHDAHFYCTRNSYTLSFTNTGNEIESASVKYQASLADALAAAGTPETPSYVDDEASFAGWYYDTACTEPVLDTDAMPAKNVSVVAKWVLPDKTVTLVDGEDELGRITTVKYGTVYSELDSGYRLTHPTKTFLGWFKNADLTEPFTYTEQISDDTTLYAGWAEATETTRAWTVRYVDGDGSELLGSATGTATDGDVLYFEAPQIDGYRAKVASQNLTLSADGSVTFEYERLGTVSIAAQSIVAYVGGISRNGGHTPKLRYRVATPETTSLARLSFEIHAVLGGEETVTHLDRESLGDNDEGAYCLFPQLGYDMGNVDDNDTRVQRGEYLKLVDRDGDSSTYAGVYDLELREGTNAWWDEWYVTATDTVTGDVYLVDVETAGATVTILEVSDEALMYEDPASLLTRVTDDPAGLAGGAKAFAVADGVTFSTNGDEALGLLGVEDLDEVEGYGDQGALVALLFDAAVSPGGGADPEGDMVRLASGSGIDLDGWNTQIRYLDLVNVNDGNARVSADGAVTVYWPYPDGVTYENASDYEFKMLHYKGLERGYFGSGADMDAVEVEEVEITPTEYGLMFSTESFSPFALAWKIADADEPDDAAGDGESKPNDAGKEDGADNKDGADEGGAKSTQVSDKKDGAGSDAGTGAGATPKTADATIGAGAAGTACMLAGAAALEIRRRLSKRERVASRRATRTRRR